MAKFDEIKKEVNIQAKTANDKDQTFRDTLMEFKQVEVKRINTWLELTDHWFQEMVEEFPQMKRKTSSVEIAKNSALGPAKAQSQAIEMASKQKEEKKAKEMAENEKIADALENDQLDEELNKMNADDAKRFKGDGLAKFDTEMPTTE